MSKKPPLGSGQRFSKLENSLESKGYNEESAQKIAASIGRKKYGNEKMRRLATNAKRAKRKKA